MSDTLGVFEADRLPVQFFISPIDDVDDFGSFTLTEGRAWVTSIDMTVASSTASSHAVRLHVVRDDLVEIAFHDEAITTDADIGFAYIEWRGAVLLLPHWTLKCQLSMGPGNHGGAQASGFFELRSPGFP